MRQFMQAVLMALSLTLTTRLEAMELKVENASDTIEVQLPHGIIQHHQLVKASGQFETMDAFVEALRPVLVNLTQVYKAEVCGWIAQKGEKEFAILVGTTKSKMLCVQLDHWIPEGYESSGWHIHTHPNVSSIRLNRHEVSLLQKLGESDRRTGEVLHGASPEKLSQADKEAGNGYLVTGQGRLIKHTQPK